MLKQLYELAKQLFVLAKESQQNKADIKELRQELKELTSVVQRFERRLPPAKLGTEKKDKK